MKQILNLILRSGQVERLDALLRSGQVERLDAFEESHRTGVRFLF